MKTDLAPSLFKSIDQNIILWFQRSNRFTIVSDENYKLLNQFLKSKTTNHFINWLQVSQEFERPDATKIAKELEEFIEASNRVSQISSPAPNSEIIRLPKDGIAVYYSFNDSILRVNYDSEITKGLFHPQLAHFSSSPSEAIAVTLDVFRIDKTLYLYKNTKFVYSCETRNYHFLQGAFAMELTNYIHNKIDANWLATFHASTICNQNEAIMIVGESGNGKSTLSALLTANGMDMLADDFTPMYAKDMKVYRYPNAISIKEGAFKVMEEKVSHFKDMDAHFNGAKQVSIKYLPTQTDFASSTKSVPCHKIIYVKYNPNACSTIKKTSADQILKTLIPDSWISGQPKHAKLFLDWLEKVTFYELEYSDNEFAFKSFKSLFDA